MSELKTDYRDDVLDVEVNSKRKFRLIENDDGTVSFEDATTYITEGSYFGGADINATNSKINAVEKQLNSMLESPSGGEAIINIQKQTNIGISPDSFAQNGNTIIASETGKSTIAISTDGGNEWGTVSLTFAVGCVHYSKTSSAFFAISFGTSAKYAKSNDGFVWEKIDIPIGDSGEIKRIYGYKIIDANNSVKMFFANSNTSSSYFQSCSYTVGENNLLIHKSISYSNFNFDIIYRTTKGVIFNSGAKKYFVGDNKAVSGVRIGTNNNGYDATLSGISNDYVFFNGLNTLKQRQFNYSKTTASEDEVFETIIPSGKQIRGFFTVERYTYVYDNTTIARANGLAAALQLPAEEFHSIGELIGISYIYNLQGKEFLASTSSGIIYKCTIV